MPKIALITTGGTIASLRDEQRDETAAALGAEQIQALVPQRALGAAIMIDAFMNVNSCAMSLQQSFGLSQRIKHHLADPDCIGAVVAHGTDTMEESA